jgi:hypothetical protein
MQKYLNNGCFSAADKFLFLISPGIVFRKNARVVVKQYHSVLMDRIGLPESRVNVDVYHGNNQYALQLMSFLRENLKDDLAGAYVHGSIGTQDEINYSDFDALLILKDEVLKNSDRLAHVASLVSEARKYMLQMDPLQHHGWFVLMESDLDDYPETYFPSVLFQHAKSLFSDKGRELRLVIDNGKQDYHTPLKKLCLAIENKIKRGKHSNSSYDLKNLLSEFMLLPALYVQSRDKKGIYKKQSFEEAKKDFLPAEWNIMDEVSLMREKWRTNAKGWRTKMISSPRFFSFNLPKILAPGISANLEMKPGEKFYRDMLDFTILVRQKNQ